MQSQLVPITVLAISSISWGLTWIPLKYFNSQGVDGISVVFFAYGIAGLGLLPIFFRQRHAWMQRTSVIVALAIFGGYANLAFSYSMVYGDVVRAMVLFYLTPVWAIIGARFFLKERVDALRWFGVALALSGAFLIVGGHHFSLDHFTTIDLIATTAGMAFAVTNLIFRAYAGMPVVSNVVAVFVGCAAMAGGLMLIGVAPWPAVSNSEFGYLAAYSVGWIMLASFASQWAVTKMEASRSAVIIIMELVAATISATLLGVKVMTLVEILGAVLVASATVLETMRSAPSTETNTTPINTNERKTNSTNSN